MANLVGNFRVSKVFKREPRYTDVAISWSTKERNVEGEEEWVWSSEPARLIGKAHDAFSGMDVGDWITLSERDAVHTNQPYDNKDGERVWVNPRNKIFGFVPRESTNSAPANRNLLADDVADNEPPEDDIPF